MDAKLIRAAVFDDLPQLVELARCYHAEAHAGYPFDPEHVAEQFRSRTIDTIDGICLKLERDREIVGFLAATVSTLFMANVRAAIELAWYVRPDARGRGGVLIDAFEDWARWKGCAVSALGMDEFPEASRSEALARLYVRRGYRCFERSFIRDLQ